MGDTTMVREFDLKLERQSRHFALLLDNTPDFKIYAAMWVYDSESGQWLFYLASPYVALHGTTTLYEYIAKILISHEFPFSLFDIRLMTVRGTSPLHSLGRMFKVVKPGPEPAPRFTNNTINGILIEDAVILWNSPA